MLPTAPSSAGKGPLPDQSLAVQAHALRVLADLIENVGIAGLSLVINAIDAGSHEISIQVPEYLGSPDERAAAVAQLTAAVGGTAVRNERPGFARSWIIAEGETGGHRVRIFTAIAENQP
jgi:hypothetical protein